jgi:hypothetical protein
MPNTSSLRACAAVAALVATAAVPLIPSGLAAAEVVRDELAPLLSATEAVPDQYVVTVERGVAPESVLRQAAPEVEPLSTYTQALNGFLARLTPDQLAAVRALPDVEAVEENGIISPNHATPVGPPRAARPARWRRRRCGAWTGSTTPLARWTASSPSTPPVGGSRST